MIDLLFKYFRNEASEHERRTISDWLEADPVENEKIYRDARFIFEASVLHDYAPRRISGWSILRIVSSCVAGAAAMVAVVLCTEYLTQQRTVYNLSEQIAIMETPAGQRAKVTLPDGSQVWLNSSSRLEYPSVFAQDKRCVKLSGEALFEVAHNAKHPFVVETFTSNIEVLGTKFNVMADADAGEFITILLEGSVQVASRINNDVIRMKPNEVVELVDGRLRLNGSPDSNSLCWVDGQLSIAGVSFEELMSKFEKAFGTTIIIQRENMPDMGYTRGKVRISDGIDHALRILQHSIDFKYTKDEEKNVIVII